MDESSIPLDPSTGPPRRETMTTPAPAPAPITVRLVVDVAAALRAGYTRAGEVAIAVTPEWLASLTPEEREALAARVGDLRHVDRGAGALPTREATLDEARRILAECVAHEAQRRVERAAERERERARDAAYDTAVEVARQTLAAHLAQWAAAPATAATMRAVLDRVGEGALAVSEAARSSVWRLSEWEAVRDLVRARDAADAAAAGVAGVEELLAGAEGGRWAWDGRATRAYATTVPLLCSAGLPRHVRAHDVSPRECVERALADIVADEQHPLRARVLAARAAADTQTRAAIAAHAAEVEAPELVAQYDAGRLSPTRAHHTVALAVRARVPALARRRSVSVTYTARGTGAPCEHPAVPQMHRGAVAPAAWRQGREAVEHAACATETTPWAQVVAYPCGATTVAVVALVGGRPYVARMDVAAECDCDEPGCESCCD